MRTKFVVQDKLQNTYSCFSHNKENLTKKSPNGLTQHQIRVRRKEGYAAAERRFMSKSVDLCCVEGNEIQGSTVKF